MYQDTLQSAPYMDATHVDTPFQTMARRLIGHADDNKRFEFFLSFSTAPEDSKNGIFDINRLTILSHSGSPIQSLNPSVP